MGHRNKYKDSRAGRYIIDKWAVFGVSASIRIS